MIFGLNKVFIRFAAILTALVLVFAGCSRSNDIKLDPKNPIKVVIWHYYHGSQKTSFDAAVKDFNDTVGYEKGIVIEAISQGGVDELAATVLAASKGELDAGRMPNIFGSYGDGALEIMKNDLLVEIDSYLSADVIAQYEDTFIHEGRIGTDKLYIFPIAKSTESLMLNMTDFEAFSDSLMSYGINETVSYDDLATWEGILRVADIYYRYTDLQTPDIENDGKAFIGIETLANYAISSSKQLGQDLVKVENGIPTFSLDEKIMAKIWDTYYNATVSGRFAKLGRFCSDDIKTGDTLGYIGSTSSASYFPTELVMPDNSVKSIEMKVLPMPVFEGGQKVAISQGAGMAVTKSTPEKEYASVLFLEWFTQPERNVLFSLGSSYMPVKKDSLDEKLLNDAFQSIESDDKGLQNSIKALRVGIEQLKENTLYSSDVFDRGTEFRSSLSALMLKSAEDDRATLLELVRNGMPYEDAFEKATEQRHKKFTEWLDSLDSVYAR